MPRCSVVGCMDVHKSLHRVPEDERATWIDFIFEGEVPAIVGKNLLVCANHFTTDCFSNLGQYTEGLAVKLPTLHGIPASEHPASSKLPATRDIGCNTEPPQRHHVGTQLSLETLHSHYRSEAVQATVSFKDFGTSTDPFTGPLPVACSTPVKPPPSKRPRLQQQEEEGEEDCLEVTEISIDAESTSKHDIRKYIVYETCLMELFEVCPVCKRVCSVKNKVLGTFISVKQLCEYCEYSRIWQSQPLLDSTPAGNLQLSAAVYISGASFFKLQRVFKAMHLQIILYDTFPIVHKWNHSQDVMLQQLSEERKVILGGDGRMDSPGHSAQYCTYTVMDEKTRAIVALEVVDKRETDRKSAIMEKKGFEKAMDSLLEADVPVKEVCTDAHPQIGSLMSKCKKACTDLKQWTRDIINHFWWVCERANTYKEFIVSTEFYTYLKKGQIDLNDNKCHGTFLYAVSKKLASQSI
uniref:THAP-type domain-containing protein n=1 Tax=Gadus morhua TaxID=8049 RepID=A0A8C5FP91_GADMO